jgi:PucR family transcriptional regulator, purine catabolism regulatory protein
VVAGGAGLDRDVQWAHVIDMPDPAPWVRPGQILLTTGFAWPTQEREVRALIRLLCERGLAAVGLAVPGYLTKFSDAAREEADRLNLPLIEIPFDIPFASVTEELHRTILAEQYKIIERSEQIHRALTRAAAEGSNLGDLARTLGELLERSVTFEDPDGKLLAYYEAGAHDDPVRRQTLADAQSPAHMQEALQASGLLEQIRTSAGPLRVPAMPEIGLTPRVVCPIRLGAELVGLVWIIEGDAKLSELDFRAAEHAALVAAVHFAHQRELATTEARLGYASFLSLLEAEGDDPQAIERARLLGFETDGRHRVGICVIPEPLPLSREGFLRRERVAAQLASALRAAGTQPLLTASLNYVTFLLPNGVDQTAVWSGLEDDSVTMVLGRSHTGTQGARRSYREAQSLLGYPDGARVRRFEDALVPRVLMGDAGAHEAFVDHMLGPLRTRKDGKALEDVLLALARHGFNLKVTSEALKIHLNTLRYRLAKALEALRLDLDDPDTRFQLQLAARILDFSAKK